MKKKMHLLVLILFLIAAFKPVNTYSQVAPAATSTTCPMCSAVPWGPVQIHQFYFTPMHLPGCSMFCELRYRTKMCNGMLMYEIIDEEFSILSGSCGFAVCAYAELHKDVEKEMLLNVLGTTNVYSSKPSACYRLVEVDPLSNPGFNDCWTHHGTTTFMNNPMVRLACSNVCCVAQAKVYYTAGGKPLVLWAPLSNVSCNDSVPVPSTVNYAVCCHTVLSGGQAVCMDEQVFPLTVTQIGPCTPYCDGSMSWKDSKVTSLDEANAVINANIRFFQSAKAVPNPSDGHFTVTIVLPSSQALTIELMDLKGQQVKQYTIQYDPANHNYPIDAHELKSGVYLCKINSAEFGDKIIKIIKD